MSTPTRSVKMQLFRLFIVLLFSLLMIGELLHGASTKEVNTKTGIANTASASDSGNDSKLAFMRSVTQSQPTASPSFLGMSDSAQPQPPSSTNTESTSSVTSDQVYIGFDFFPSGAPVGYLTPIGNQYPQARFSSDSFHYPLADNQFWNTSRPNLLGRAPLFGFYDGTGYAPLYVDFTTPVNNLKFYMAAVDDFRQNVAQLNIFQNNHLTATRHLDGYGRVFQPVLVDVGQMGFNNVTRIEVVNINDSNGVGFDDFSFTPVPPVSPTPTPQPTPPRPTELTATVTDRQVRLTWTGSQSATSYYVKRSSSSGGPYETLGAAQDPPYVDQTPAGDRTYFYVVSAFNSGGESVNSTEVSAAIPSACGDSPGITQSPGRITSTSGWAMTVEVSANDGVVLKDVSLNGRYMARSISIPYFTVATSKTLEIGTPPLGTLRGELKPNSNDNSMRSRLVHLTAENVFDGYGDGGIEIQAEYVIDRISPGSDSCLHVTQNYAFFGKLLTQLFNGGRPCEPSGTVKCEMYSPWVEYAFESRNGEVLRSFTAVQRNEFWVSGLPVNSIGVFRDCDSPISNCKYHVDFDNGRVSQFTRILNPLTTEMLGHAVVRGQDAGEWDNIHQTYDESVAPDPGAQADSSALFLFKIRGGCPGCMHMHWRWGRTVELSGQYWGNGGVGFYYSGSNQDMDFAIVKYKPTEQENAEPQNYAALADHESIRLGSNTGDHILVYYAATGYRQNDLFFRHLYFFNPDFGSTTKSVSASQQEGEPPPPQDGPISVTFAHQYSEGTVSFNQFDPSLVGSLPSGYQAYSDTGFNITTDAEVDSPYVVSFGVPSATDQSVFNSLRILHAEPDPLDPDHGIWVDRTVLPPDAPAPNYTGKVISARTSNLAGFLIARLVSPLSNTGTADLDVNTSTSPDPVVAPNTLTYTVTVHNGGPDTATGAGLIDSLSADVDFVSASPSQGTCKSDKGKVYCKLGSLTSGSSAVVTITARPDEGGNRFPEEGKSLLNSALAIAAENDPNQDNNTSIVTTMALRDPHAPPTVAITSPANGARYTGPTNLTLTASAIGESPIAAVDFYDDVVLIGSGVPTGSNQYAFSWNNVSFGNHFVTAVATDTAGRKKGSDPVNIVVNGPATVNITSPANGSVIAPHATVGITANATTSSGTISKVDFFANATLIGTVSGGGQCAINWIDVPNGKYTITAVATDDSGVASTSLPVSVVISNSPTVTISSPQDGATFASAPILVITANASDDDTIIDKVTFYANGAPLGNGLRSDVNQFRFTWRNAPDGIFSLTAVSTDQYGLTTTSHAVTIGVNTPSPLPGEFVWFDDDPPLGAVAQGDGDLPWVNVRANPGPFSGDTSHQSGSFGLPDATSVHRHWFEGASTPFAVNNGDRLFAYVFLHANYLPRELMLEWKDANGWNHRAYWGEDRITSGLGGGTSRAYMGPLPPADRWVRLEVPASSVGLVGSQVSGMSFTLEGGRATWDLAGKLIANAPPPPTSAPGDTVWIEDGLPTGAVTSANNDDWNWINNNNAGNVFSGSKAHQSRLSANHTEQVWREHSFTGAQTPMQVNSGDLLFTWVKIEPVQGIEHPAQQIMLQWYDGNSWEHRAYWGENYIGRNPGGHGVEGTESARYMGGLPPTGGWYRLQVPASYVGLEGKSVTGMAFTMAGMGPTVTWDQSGKSTQLTSSIIPQPLSPLSEVWEFKTKAPSLYLYDTNHLASGPYQINKKGAFFVYSNPAPGTIPLNRYRRPTPSNGDEYFYARSNPGGNWVLDGLAFYVYPDGTTPGTKGLYLYQPAGASYYALTVDPSLSGGNPPVAYVFAELPPTAPSNLRIGTNGATLDWEDKSSNELRFRLDADGGSGSGDESSLNTTVPANTVHYDTGINVGHSGNQCMGAAVRAENLIGNSFEATAVYGGCHGDAQPLPDDPEITLPGPVNVGAAPETPALAPRNLTASAGTVSKVEYYSNGVKVGESTNAPYSFLWSNAVAGTYTLSANAITSTGSFDPGVLFDWPTSVGIVSPARGQIVDSISAITANAYDLDGAGTITKVEFFANGSKIGEVTTAPFVFVWNNSTPGDYCLSAKATDAAGVVSTSAVINVKIVTGAGGPNPPAFTDPDLLASGVYIKAVHITELRDAINVLRQRYGLAAYVWTKPTATGGVVAPGGSITADPIVEMRTALDEVLGPPSSGYAAGLAQGLPILAIHLQELRNRVADGWNPSSQNSCN